MLGGCQRSGVGGKTALRPFAGLLAALYLAGCQAVAPAPQTFNQGWAYAEALHTTVLQGITAAVQHSTLKSERALTVLAQADDAQSLLLLAKAAYGRGDTLGAQTGLQRATEILAALQAQFGQVNP